MGDFIYAAVSPITLVGQLDAAFTYREMPSVLTRNLSLRVGIKLGHWPGRGQMQNNNMKERKKHMKAGGTRLIATGSRFAKVPGPYRVHVS